MKKKVIFTKKGVFTKGIFEYSNSFVPVPFPFRYLFVRHRSLAVPSKFLTVPGPFPHRSGLKKSNKDKRYRYRYYYHYRYRYRYRYF